MTCNIYHAASGERLDTVTLNEADSALVAALSGMDPRGSYPEGSFNKWQAPLSLGHIGCWRMYALEVPAPIESQTKESQ